MATLAAENERLRRDNERCVRLIDSGEWGRGRVAELVAAGEVLQGERDALLKLIQALRTQFEALQDAQQQQQQQQLVGQPLRASSHGSSVAVMSQVRLLQPPPTLCSAASCTLFLGASGQPEAWTGMHACRNCFPSTNALHAPSSRGRRRTRATAC